MDALTHLFLPLTVAYVLAPRHFEDWRAFSLGAFGLLPDADKLFGLQGAFHSLLFIMIAGGFLFAIEYFVSGELRYAPLATALLGSHLVLDFLDGGPVFLLLPAWGSGVGVTFPTQISMGASPTNVSVSNPLPSLRTQTVNRGANTYSLFSGYGVLSMLIFMIIVAGTRFRQSLNEF